MGAIIGALISWVLGFIFKKPAPLTQEAQQAAKAAVAETQLATETTANAQIATAIEAQRQSDARIAADPDSVRSPDPDSRD